MGKGIPKFTLLFEYVGHVVTEDESRRSVRLILALADDKDADARAYDGRGDEREGIFQRQATAWGDVHRG